MSRFKFRAWDEVGQKMVNDVTVYDGGDHVGFGEPDDYAAWLEQSNTDIGDYGWMFLLDSFVVMQCTGLRDKHDRPIYEGDIINVAGALYTVAWRVETASFVKVGRRGSYTSPVHSYQLAEVVGNIYENRDLLTPEDAALLGLRDYQGDDHDD